MKRTFNKMLTLDEIRLKCRDGRFFEYSGYHDRFFVPIAIYVIWISLRLKLSGNQISWISGLVALMGAIMLTSENKLVIFFGSFGYLIWYLLDYVDGAVSRINGLGSVSGQFIDWMMHVFSHVGIITGIAIGALIVSGTWIIPFAILAILAACLNLSTISMAWFSICMEQQQRRASNKSIHYESEPKLRLFNWFRLKKIRGFTIFVFHENYLIFWLPIASLIHLSGLFGSIDLRVLFVILAGLFYFPIQCLEIYRLIYEKRIERGYFLMFSSDSLPRLPQDHFFK